MVNCLNYSICSHGSQEVERSPFQLDYPFSNIDGVYDGYPRKPRRLTTHNIHFPPFDHISHSVIENRSKKSSYFEF